jgi:periplasmic divalent cation tolerance protein
MQPEKLLVGWTTANTAELANKLAAGFIAARLAACVVVDGPVTSHYWWEGKQTRAEEWRLTVKFPADRAEEILAWLKAHHPYENPQWFAVEAVTAAATYRKWVVDNTRPPFPRKRGTRAPYLSEK